MISNFQFRLYACQHPPIVLISNKWNAIKYCQFHLITNNNSVLLRQCFFFFNQNKKKESVFSLKKIKMSLSILSSFQLRETSAKREEWKSTFASKDFGFEIASFYVFIHFSYVYPFQSVFSFQIIGWRRRKEKKECRTISQMRCCWRYFRD